MEFNKYKIGVDFIVENNQVKIKQSCLKKIKPKKITGSRIGSVVGVNNYVTPFQVWCDMMGFYESELETYFINAGVIIEPKIKDYVDRKLNVFYQQYDPKKHKFDMFPDNKIFGGIPDGEILNHQKRIDDSKDYPLLEIKTVSLDEYMGKTEKNELVLVKENNLPIVKSKLTKINKGIVNGSVNVPLHYQYQLALYLYLRNVNKGIFAIGFLEDHNYRYPDTYDPFNEQNSLIILESFSLDTNTFSSIIDYCTNWYNNHIVTGISPVMSVKDAAGLSYGYEF